MSINASYTFDKPQVRQDFVFTVPAGGVKGGRITDVAEEELNHLLLASVNRFVPKVQDGQDFWIKIEMGTLA